MWGPCDLTRARIPCLEAAYSGALDTLMVATEATDPIWTITPPCPEVGVRREAEQPGM